jgi:hypothetical protein
VLGKFLGYLVFLPYQHIVATINSKEFISLRNNVGFLLC